MILGVYTGAAYRDIRLRKEFIGEGKMDGSVVVVKTHFPFNTYQPTDGQLHPSKVWFLLEVGSKGEATLVYL